MTSPNLPRRRLLNAILAVLGALGPFAGTRAADRRTFKIISPYPPGGSTDAIGRVLAEELGRALDQTWIVENFPGGNGIPGVRRVIDSEPNGETSVLGYSVLFTLFPLTQAAALTFSPAKDLKLASLIGAQPYLIAAGALAKGDGIRQFLAAGDFSRQPLFIGSAGTGAPSHFIAEQIGKLNRVEVTHVQYKGTAQVAVAIAAGDIPLGILDITAARPLVAAGKVKILGTTAAQRTPQFANVPTMEEQGYPGFNYDIWVGLFVPGRTPDSLVVPLHRAMQDALGTPGVADRLREIGLTVLRLNPDESRSFIERDVKRWATIIAESNLKF